MATSLPLPISRGTHLDEAARGHVSRRVFCSAAVVLARRCDATAPPPSAHSKHCLSLLPRRVRHRQPLRLPPPSVVANGRLFRRRTRWTLKVASELLEALPLSAQCRLVFPSILLLLATSVLASSEPTPPALAQNLVLEETLGSELLSVLPSAEDDPSIRHSDETTAVEVLRKVKPHGQTKNALLRVHHPGEKDVAKLYSAFRRRRAGKALLVVATTLGIAVAGAFWLLRHRPQTLYRSKFEREKLEAAGVFTAAGLSIGSLIAGTTLYALARRSAERATMHSIERFRQDVALPPDEEHSREAQ